MCKCLADCVTLCRSATVINIRILLTATSYFSPSLHYVWMVTSRIFLNKKNLSLSELEITITKTPIGPFVVILSQIKELVIRILEMFLAELSRKFGNHVTVHRPTARRSVRTTGIPIFTLTFSSYFGSPLIAHQCCDQLTAVKTRYPLTSITWPYRGLRCRPIQVEYFFCSYPLTSY